MIEFDSLSVKPHSLFKLAKLFRNKIFLSALVAVVVVLAAKIWLHPDEHKLAEIDGAVVTDHQIESILGRQLTQLNQQIYQLKQQKLDELINAQLLTGEAKRGSISVATLLEREVNGKVIPVSELEIRNFYERNKDRIRLDLAKVHDQIRDYLNSQHQNARREEYFKELRAKATVTTYLKPPPVYRANVPFRGAPIRGAEGAPVTIIKFEDFQCPFCKTAQPTFKELLKKYDGKVRLIHKDLPLEEIHPLARQAAEAGRCAEEQGKFWEYHDQLYADSPNLSADDLKSAAKEVGLNVQTFDQIGRAHV